jgi:Ser/Thr protein kinase RdoA (MazF antagonist)
MLEDGVSEQSGFFATLVATVYGLPAATLEPLHLHANDGSGVYRVEQKNGPSYVLRTYAQAHRADDRLMASATTLTFLEQQDYPAPRVLCALDGGLIGVYNGWQTLMITFIDGETADFTPESLRLIGAALGRLHMLDPVIAALPPPSVPDSRWRSSNVVLPALERLAMVRSTVPPEILAIYEVCLETLQRNFQRNDLPSAIVHTDCWPSNAIRTSDGRIVLIDWDGCGIGSAVLDLGNLLVTCHLGKPQLPQMHADPVAIAAVVDGYRRQRPLTAPELDTLLDAVRFNIAFYAASILPDALQGEWRDHIFVHKLLARFSISTEIANIAGARFAASLDG